MCGRQRQTCDCKYLYIIFIVLYIVFFFYIQLAETFFMDFYNKKEKSNIFCFFLSWLNYLK